MELSINPKKTALLFVKVIAVLFFLNICAYVARFFLGYNSQVNTFFSFGYERNLPTYYSALALMLCAALLLVIAYPKIKAREKFAFRWALLSAIFAYISVDEMLEIHEKLIKPLRRLLHVHGIFHFAWVIPFGIAGLILLAFYAGFLLDLPKRIRSMFFIAAAVYIGGAMGVEMIGSAYVETHGPNHFAYVMMQTVEETLEMAGVVIFIYALLRYIQMTSKEISLKIE